MTVSTRKFSYSDNSFIALLSAIQKTILDDDDDGKIYAIHSII